MKSKKNVTYVQKSFTMIKMKKQKQKTKYSKKLEIIVIMQENLEE